MRWLIAVTLLVALGCGLLGCGGQATQAPTQPPAPPPPDAGKGAQKAVMPG